MKLFDLHCDTAGELYFRKLAFDNNQTHINMAAAKNIGPYTQIFAIWTPKDMSNNQAYQNFFDTLDYFHKKADLPKEITPIFAVEGGRILDGDISRLDILYSAGVRVMTLVWSGSCCIGGAYDTNIGLTPFGEDVVKRCFQLGITPCLSHASDKMIQQVCQLATAVGRPVIASHSNARAVHNHPRNLSDQCAKAILSTGGLIGLSLCPQHLVTDNQVCSAADVIPHAKHFFSLGAEAKKQLCLGCDFDGIETTPIDINNVGQLGALSKQMLLSWFTKEQVDDVFWNNGARFFGDVM